jgi:hypothetical protein
MTDRDWYTNLDTAEDIAKACEVLMRWIEQTGDEDAGCRMAEAITARAVELGLETP